MNIEQIWLPACIFFNQTASCKYNIILLFPSLVTSKVHEKFLAAVPQPANSITPFILLYRKTHFATLSFSTSSICHLKICLKATSMCNTSYTYNLGEEIKQPSLREGWKKPISISTGRSLCI